MRTVNKISRQSWGCGYEPAATAGIPVRTWDHRGRERQRDEYAKDGTPIVNVCPGYLATLPEVVDVARAHLHWGKGQLAIFCHGEPTDDMLIGVEIFEGAVNACSNWEIKNPKERS